MPLSGRWQRIFLERGTEPLHLNLTSVIVALFGSFRAKVAFDVVVRRPNAYSLLHQADKASALGKRRAVAVEFGVAAGAGLLNMAAIAKKVREVTGVEFEIYGFDTGSGMPPPRDYRDHPELYAAGRYPMDIERLHAALPSNTHLVIGELTDNVPSFLASLTPDVPLAFVSIDVDYYWSTKGALEILAGPPDVYLPTTLIYFDDISLESHNRWAGELLAIREFNLEHETRKIEQFHFLRTWRVFKQARWLDQLHTLHVLDHPTRQAGHGRLATAAHP
jgi:hypothetical protein